MARLGVHTRDGQVRLAAYVRVGREGGGFRHLRAAPPRRAFFNVPTQVWGRIWLYLALPDYEQLLLQVGLAVALFVILPIFLLTDLCLICFFFHDCYVAVRKFWPDARE